MPLVLGPVVVRVSCLCVGVRGYSHREFRARFTHVLRGIQISALVQTMCVTMWVAVPVVMCITIKIQVVQVVVVVAVVVWEEVG